jgi:hypothetical protein
VCAWGWGFSIQAVLKNLFDFVVSNAIYPFLEQKCIEGTRTESKYAIITIASLHPSDDKKFAKLYKVRWLLYNSRWITFLLQGIQCLLWCLCMLFHYRWHDLCGPFFYNQYHIGVCMLNLYNLLFVFFYCCEL